MATDTQQLLSKVRSCTLCEPYLEHGVRPVLQLHPDAKVLIVGQAPGRKVHESGVPFDDASGNRLRDWMGINKETFYDPKKVAILPMGFCYPGTGKSGDLPPRPECAPAWREALLDTLINLQLTLVIGQYAMAYHLPKTDKNLTETVKAWRTLDPAHLPLPHPSPRNNIWLKKNQWFEQEFVPYLQNRIKDYL